MITRVNSWIGKIEKMITRVNSWIVTNSPKIDLIFAIFLKTAISIVALFIDNFENHMFFKSMFFSFKNENLGENDNSKLLSRNSA